MSDKELSRGTRVRVEFEGEVIGYGESGWCYTVKPDGHHTVYLFEGVGYDVPGDSVTVTQPALKKGQVWKNQNGDRFLVIQAVVHPTDKLRFINLKGSHIEFDEMDFNEMELELDA